MNHSVQPNPVIHEDVEHMVSAMGDKLDVMAGKTMLLTGALGFLGSYFLSAFYILNKHVLKTPMKIIAVDNQPAPGEGRLSFLARDDAFTYISQDITKSLDKIDGEMDYIIHAASIASPTFYRKHPLETIDVNVNGTWRVLELAQARQVDSVIYYSSSEIYGDPASDKIPTSESYWGNVSCTGPRACYDESKRLGETLCMMFHQQHHVPIKIIRPFNVYGPGQRLDDKRIIPDLMNAALNKQPIILHSDGTPTRSFCYVSDFLAATLHVLLSQEDGEIFNVGNDEERSIKEVANMVAALAQDPPLEVQFQESSDASYLKDNPNRRCPDLSKMQSTYQWVPSISLQHGLERTLRAYQLEL